MPTIEALIEGEKRGLLNEQNTAILMEARKRGMAPDIQDQESSVGASMSQEPDLGTVAQTSRTPGPGMVANMFAQIPGVEKTREFINESHPGATVGGVVGSLTPAPLLTGAIGAFIGEQVEAQLRNILTDKKKSQLEIAKDAGIQGAQDLILGSGSKLVMYGLKKAMAPFRKTITRQGAKASKYLKNIGTDLLPAEKTESRILDIFHNMTENSLVGGEFVKKFKLGRTELLEKATDDFINSFGKKLTDTEMGYAIVNSTKLSKQVIEDSLIDPMYKRITALTKKRVVKTSKEYVFDTGGKYLLDTGNIGIINISKGTKNIPSAKGFAIAVSKRSADIQNFGSRLSGADLAGDIVGQLDDLSFEAAKDLRSLLLKAADEFSIENKNAPAIGVAKTLAGKVDAAIAKGLKKYSPASYKLWRDANQIYNETRKQFNNKFIRKLVKMADENFGNAPEKLADQIFRSHNPSAIKNIKDALAADPETWKNLQSWNTRALLKKATNKEGVLKGTDLVNQMYGRNGLGAEAMKEIYENSELRAFDDLARAMKVSQATQAEGLGRMWIQLTQAGAFVGLFMGGTITGTSVFIMAAPAAIGKIMTKPSTAKWLTEGFKLPPGSTKGAMVFSRFLGALTEAGINYSVMQGEFNPNKTRDDRISPQGQTQPIP